VKHEAGEGDETQAGHRFGQALVVLGQPAEARCPGEVALHHPPPGQQHEPLLLRRQPHRRQLDAAGLRSLEGIIPGVSLVDPGQLDGVARGVLDGVGEVPDLGPLLVAGGRRPHGQQVPERVDRRVEHAAPRLFVPVLPGAAAALRRGAQRPGVEDDRRWVGVAPRGLPKQRPQVVDHVLEAVGGEPALGLSIDRRPRREVAGEVAPGRAGAHDPAQGIVDLARVVPSLRGVRRHQRQVRSHEGPLLVRHVARVGLAGNRRHFPSLRLHPSPWHALVVRQP